MIISGPVEQRAVNKVILLNPTWSTLLLSARFSRVIRCQACSYSSEMRTRECRQGGERVTVGKNGPEKRETAAAKSAAFRSELILRPDILPK